MNEPARQTDTDVRTETDRTEQNGNIRGPKGKVVRLTDALVTSAEHHAAVARRSAPKQIEYWAQLGHLLESSLSATEIHALLSGQKFVASARLASSTVPDADTVLSELDGARKDGTLRASLSKSEAVYDIAADGATLRRTTADGRTELGVFIDGQFVARQAQA